MGLEWKLRMLWNFHHLDGVVHEEEKYRLTFCEDGGAIDAVGLVEGKVIAKGPKRKPAANI